VLRQLCGTIRLNDLPGAFREGSVDLDRDLLERAVAGKPGKALVHELASAIEFAALTSQLCSEERQLWSAESSVLGYLVKPVIGVIVGQPVQ
jgi:hypothetical protein